MSVDRFSAIVFPLKSVRFRTRKNLIIGLGSMSLFSLVINAPTIIIYSPYGNDVPGNITVGKCAVQTSGSADDNRLVVLGGIFFASFSLFAYLFPLVAIGTMHITIFIRLMRTRAIRMSRTNNHAYIHIRAAKIVMTLFLTFFVCWTLMHVIYMLYFYGDLQNRPSFLHLHVAIDTANTMATVNSCLNPFLYTLLSSEYRTKLKTLVYGWGNGVLTWMPGVPMWSLYFLKKKQQNLVRKNM